MVKICQTGLLTLNFESIPKKRIFRFLPKISAGHAWSWKFFFANFQILGPYGCQGWVVMPQNVKKSQNHCTLVCMSCVIWVTTIVCEQKHYILVTSAEIDSSSLLDILSSPCQSNRCGMASPSSSHRVYRVLSRRRVCPNPLVGGGHTLYI
jgi:hypothetical protein